MRRAIRGGAYHWHEYDIASLLPPPGGEDRTALLLGCGDGAEKPYLQEAGFRPIGIDVRRLPGGADAVADAHCLPLTQACMDLVLSMQVFEHLRTPWTAAREVARVLRPGGWFVGSVAFLKPYHQSYFHMTHRGIVALLSQAGLVTDRLSGAQSLTFSIYGAMIPGLDLRTKRTLLGTFDRLLFGSRSLVWRVARRKDPRRASDRFGEEIPLSFRTLDRLRYAPAVVFRARKPVNTREPAAAFNK